MFDNIRNQSIIIIQESILSSIFNDKFIVFSQIILIKALKNKINKNNNDKVNKIIDKSS